MKVLFKFVLLVGFMLLTSFSLHKYYVSITKVEIDTEEHLIKVYSQFFVDDFQKVIQERYGVSILDFYSLTEVEQEYIKDYVKKKLKLSINRTPIPLHYLGYELENEFLYIYVQAKIQEDVKRFDIENKLLMDIFPSQLNTIDVTYKEKVKSVQLHSESSKGTLYYE